MRIPLFIEMQNKDVLVIGGGSIGTSRTRKFSSAGAFVTVLSSDFSDELRELGADGKARLIKGDASNKILLEELISNSDIVVVALDTLELNDTVIGLAKKYGALVNLANDADGTEVVVPFETEVKGLRIAMTSEGKSGIVVREALKRVVDFLSNDREIANLLNLMHHLKVFMKSAGVPVKTRMKLYSEVFGDEEFRARARGGDIDGAKGRAEEIIRVRRYGYH